MVQETLSFSTQKSCDYSGAVEYTVATSMMISSDMQESPLLTAHTTRR